MCLAPNPCESICGKERSPCCLWQIAAIGNLQQWPIRTYHGVTRDQLQVDLHEFVFCHNRRWQPMGAFQTLLGLGTGRKPSPYKEIRGGVDLLTPSNKD
jgi:hypothetical protein